MFNVNPEATFPHTVKVSKPGGGQADLPLIFRRKRRTEALDYFKPQPEGEPQSSDLDMVVGLVAGWGDGVDQPFSVAALADVLENYPGAARQICDAYMPALWGAVEGK